MRAPNPISLPRFITQIGTYSVAHNCRRSSPAQARRLSEQQPCNGTLSSPIFRADSQETELERAARESTHLALCMLYVVLFWVGAIAALSLL